ncbi:MAG TPA: VWA-like domain-containing protein [Planctomycetota bacterium]
MRWPFRRKTQQQAAPPPPASGGLHEGWFEAMLRESGFVRRFPQYAGVVARMTPILTDAVPFMAVGLRRWDDPGARVCLMVNPAFLRQHGELVAGVLLHEVHHVVLGHLSELRFHAVTSPTAMEVAMEISANENIREPVPPSPFVVETFAPFGIAPGQSTMERYALLASAVREGKLRLPDLRTTTWDVHRPRQAGCPAIGAGDLLDARSDGATANNWNRGFGLGLPANEQKLERLRHQIAAHLGGERAGGDDVASGTQRRVAKELPRRILGEGQRGRLDWPRILRDVFPQQRRVHPDYKRPNRRFPERVGELPGRTRRPPRPHLLAAIDTSGSMDITALQQVVAEVRQLRRYARLTIVLCDAAVHRLPPNASLDVLVGSGDTDFGPVFAELPALPDCVGVVYFTDGRGAMPAKPPTSPTLWVVTHERPFAPGFGSIVRMPELGAARR